ncbi:hypothetical protein UMC2PCS14_00481 (plasmid) [[Clostridium] sordellii]|uniref:hypothetical protein n=1 Tax=Paraclostridium sordellii TaxID=1505 RepID=UPI000540FC74|nr:hypothetical protein [Paeniclostridium sordellii]CEK36624.1 hypothetical protein UMC2PCS14_00481 (plasmid) [[Clostridium] sordellii] [Paeniclostridium sordellii]
MEIKIENLSIDFVKKIDDMAKKKGVSRNEFLKNYFTNIAIQNELFNVFTRNERLLSKLEFSINENSKVLKKVNESIL